MSYNPAGFSLDVQDPGGAGWIEPLPPAETSERLNLLNVLGRPAALIERALTAVDRIQRGMRPVRRAAVVGTDLLGLLATLALRVRGTEVVVLGPFSEPLLSPNRVKGIAGWKHVWMNPALAAIPLVQEAGASYVCARDMSIDGATRRFGSFDVIVVASAHLARLQDLARGLSGNGALIDLTLNDGIVEIRTASARRSLDVKYRVTSRDDSDDGIHRERAIRYLALAGTLYPGWLARAMNSLEAPPSECDPLQLEMSPSSWVDGTFRIEQKEHELI